jgi:uroporphyrinogen-III synthase
MFTFAARMDRPAAEDFEAVLFTSANAPRHGGDGLAPFRALPCYAVGEATALAAAEAGLAT